VGRVKFAVEERENEIGLRGTCVEKGGDEIPDRRKFVAVLAPLGVEHDASVDSGVEVGRVCCGVGYWRWQGLCGDRVEVEIVGESGGVPVVEVSIATGRYGLFVVRCGCCTRWTRYTR